MTLFDKSAGTGVDGPFSDSPFSDSTGAASADSPVTAPADPGALGCPDYQARRKLIKQTLLVNIVKRWSVPKDILNDDAGQEFRLDLLLKTANRYLPTQVDHEELSKLLDETFEHLVVVNRWNSWPSEAVLAEALIRATTAWDRQKNPPVLAKPTSPPQPRRHGPCDWSAQDLEEWNRKTAELKKEGKETGTYDRRRVEARERVAKVAEQALAGKAPDLEKPPSKPL